MARKLEISARQIFAICRGAAKAGFVAELVINGVVVRLVPESQAVRIRSEEAELDEELRRWEDKKDGIRV